MHLLLGWSSSCNGLLWSENEGSECRYGWKFREKRYEIMFDIGD